MPVTSAWTAMKTDLTALLVSKREMFADTGVLYLKRMIVKYVIIMGLINSNSTIIEINTNEKFDLHAYF